MTFRSGYVTLIGRPNVGKSSLINALLHEKVAAVSSKPQTTRNAVRCILTTDEAQIVFVDTPGLHSPKHALGEFMMHEADEAVSCVDVICLVVEAGKPFDVASDELVAASLANVNVPVILVVNKIDKLNDKEKFWRALEGVHSVISPAAVVPVSAKNGTNLDVLQDEIKKLLPEGDLIYPEDMLVDSTERFLAAETIREKILTLTAQEVPHSVAVCIEEYKDPEEYPELSLTTIRATIIVERAGQKGIIIGKGGAMLKEIGSSARRDIEERIGGKVFLELWVKVKPDWRKSRDELRRLGYVF